MGHGFKNRRRKKCSNILHVIENRVKKKKKKVKYSTRKVDRKNDVWLKRGQEKGVRGIVEFKT